MHRSLRSTSFIALAVVLSACAKPPVPVVETKGDCADFNKAQVCTWSRMQGPVLVAAGVTVPIASIENMVATPDMSWPPTADAVANMPAASQAPSGFNYVSINNEPMGHAPAPFLTPHIDFHFYLVPPADVAAIDCKDLSKPAALAEGYALPDIPTPASFAKATGVSSLVGICVPKMGMHSLLATELNGTAPFRGSMLVGYTKGKPIFIEPMLSKAMLMEKKSFDLAVPTVPGLVGMYPRAFHASYDDQAQAYQFVFSAFAPGA